MTDLQTTSRQPPARMMSPGAVKVPPHSAEAEQAVLGGVMLESSAWDQIIDKLREDDFYRHEHRLIFRSIGRLIDQSKPIDVLTVSEALREMHELDQVGGEVYLFELANNTPSAANIVAYADIVRERSIQRQLIAVGSDIAENAFHPQGRSITELLDTAERSVFSISDQGSRVGPVNIKDFLAKTMDKIDTLFHSNTPITGIPTG